MVQRDHFRVGDDDKYGNQVLVPTESARHAKLSDFQTPKGKPQNELRQIFKNKKLNVSGITKR